MLLLISFMFEKVTKWFASKATDGAIEGVKTSVNDKFDQYGDIFRIGIVLAVIAVSGHHIAKQNRRNAYIPGPEPMNLPSGQPIVINNYYPDYRQTLTSNERRERPYHERNKFIPIPQQTGKKNPNR